MYLKGGDVYEKETIEQSIIWNTVMYVYAICTQRNSRSINLSGYG